jgi:alkylation response protein AidB-like acyl-CoA dehydrogenase
MADRKIAVGGEFLVVDTNPEDVFAPEEFSQEHKMIFSAAADFVKKEIQPHADRIEEKDEAFARHLFKMSGELGLNATDIAEEYGGEEMDKVSTCLVTEAMGGAPSFTAAHGAHTGIGTLPIVYFGTEDQKKKYLPKLATGEWVAAYCLTESNAGSDALNIQTTATLSEDGNAYVLNGEKIYITNGAWADVFIVYAKVDGDKFTGFIVERSFPGVSHGAEEKKMGIKGSSTTSVIFKDARVPMENLLFEIGKGHKIAFNILNIGRYKLCAGTVGGCKIAVGEAVKYANMREQFGKKISSFGMIKSKLADMCIRTYMAESLTYRLAAAIDDKLNTLDDAAKKSGAENAKAIEEYAVECSMAKVYGSECLDFCADEMVQIFGGNGYVSEYPAERMYRDSRINRIFEGTNEINRLLVPGTILKRAMQGRVPLLDAIQAVGEEIKAYAPDSVKPEGTSLGAQQHLVKMCKKIFLMSAGVAANKLLANLQEEQEVLGTMADMIIEIYAMESGLLRAQKFVDKKGEDKGALHIAAVKAYVNDALPKIVHGAKKMLVYVVDDETLGANLAAVDKLAAYQPIDTIGLRRLIAERVIKGKKYPY